MNLLLVGSELGNGYQLWAPREPVARATAPGGLEARPGASATLARERYFLQADVSSTSDEVPSEFFVEKPKFSFPRQRVRPMSG